VKQHQLSEKTNVGAAIQEDRRLGHAVDRRGEQRNRIGFVAGKAVFAPDERPIQRHHDRFRLVQWEGSALVEKV
jgi:hypothetical protein